MKNEIHPGAVVSPQTELGDGNRIGPFVVIEPGVVIGDRNWVGSHAVLKSGTRVGSDNQICEHAVIGGIPQDFKFSGVESFVQIGDGNVLREGVTAHRGAREGSHTVVGNQNYLMAYAHVAHDCRLEDHIVLANNVALAGDVAIESRVFVSGGVVVHQFTRLGQLAMIGGNSKITQDALPYMITDGVPARTRGLNRVGLQRAGFNVQEMDQLKKAYRILLRSGLPLQVALEQLKGMDSPHVNGLRQFILNSKRGFHRSA